MKFAARFAEFFPLSQSSERLARLGPLNRCSHKVVNLEFFPCERPRELYIQIAILIAFCVHSIVQNRSPFPNLEMLDDETAKSAKLPSKKNVLLFTIIYNYCDEKTLSIFLSISKMTSNEKPSFLNGPRNFLLFHAFFD